VLTLLAVENVFDASEASFTGCRVSWGLISQRFRGGFICKSLGGVVSDAHSELLTPPRSCGDGGETFAYSWDSWELLSCWLISPTFELFLGSGKLVAVTSDGVISPIVGLAVRRAGDADGRDLLVSLFGISE